MREIMATEQKIEQNWETPTPEQIVALTAQHVAAMEKLDLDVVWIQAGMHHVLLTTVGRKSGKHHKVALPYWADPDGNRIIVGSFAGAEAHPSWFVNLSDRTANPEVRCKVQNGEFWSLQEILDGEDYETTWNLLCEDRAWYRDYQAKTARRIPLVRLRETRPIAP
jgi:deazaflavin-dependent oxidoreductase (nitroreductase family)